MSDTTNTAPEGATTPPVDTLMTGRAELAALAAEAAGLRPELASRLQGSNLTELVADARSLSAAIAPPESADASDGASATASEAAAAVAAEEPGEPITPEGMRREPPGGQWNRESVRLLARENPDQFNRLVEDGTIRLSELSR